MKESTIKEGSLEAPKRAPIEWRTEAYYDQEAVNAELERVYDICHGCRRCVNLCDAFPTLFDLVDESDTMEVDGVDKADYGKVVDQCFLCDLCAETKCPYLPPHEWAVDFPHLMLRAKAAEYRTNKRPWRDRLITSTDPVFKTISTPVISQLANAAAGIGGLRKLGQQVAGIHANAPLPSFHSNTARKRIGASFDDLTPRPGATTTGRVALFVTCYGNHNEPGVVEDLVHVLHHNGIGVKLIEDTRCCAMPKFELGDLTSVDENARHNLARFKAAVDEGYDLMSVIPSCTLMYRQEIPLMYPDDAVARDVAAHFFDPFEYLTTRHKEGLTNVEFARGLGSVAYHAACHQRVQAFGQRTKDFLSLIPDTKVTIIERCSGHDGTYAVKAETYEKAMKIARPVIRQVKAAEPDHYGSDCPMAGRLIEHGLDDESSSVHPISMVRKAYGIV